MAREHLREMKEIAHKIIIFTSTGSYYISFLRFSTGHFLQHFMYTTAFIGKWCADFYIFVKGLSTIKIFDIHPRRFCFPHKKNLPGNSDLFYLRFVCQNSSRFFKSGRNCDKPVNKTVHRMGRS